MNNSESTVTMEVVRSKLDELRAEFQRGEAELSAVERRRMHLAETLLQLRGAIQALAELESQAAAAEPPTVAAIA